MDSSSWNVGALWNLYGLPHGHVDCRSLDDHGFLSVGRWSADGLDEKRKCVYMCGFVTQRFCFKDGLYDGKNVLLIYLYCLFWWLAMELCKVLVVMVDVSFCLNSSLSDFDVSCLGEAAVSR